MQTYPWDKAHLNRTWNQKDAEQHNCSSQADSVIFIICEDGQLNSFVCNLQNRKYVTSLKSFGILFHIVGPLKEE